MSATAVRNNAHGMSLDVSRDGMHLRNVEVPVKVVSFFRPMRGCHHMCDSS